MHDHGQPTRQGYDRLFHPAAPGDLYRPGFEPGPFLRPQHALSCFVESFNRPGGNATGVLLLTNQLEPKLLGLLRDMVPNASTVGFLVNPSFPASESQLSDMQNAARAMTQPIHVLRANTDREIEAAFETITQRRIPALAVAASPFFDTRRNRLVELANVMECQRSTTSVSSLRLAVL